MMPHRGRTAHVPSPRVRLQLPALLLAVSTVLAGCAAPSPTTTYTDDEGETVTVDWSDYPADSYTDAEDVLGLPTVEEVDERWSEIRSAVTTAIESELAGEYGELEWRSSGQGGWFPYGGNGYGGESMLTVYNSASWEAEVVLPAAMWPRVIEAAERELANRGIRATDAGAPADSESETADWLLVGDFFQSGEFMSVSVQDARRDEAAMKDAEEYGGLISGISLFYGIQTLSADDRGAFTRAAEPFEGLDRPDPTHSD